MIALSLEGKKNSLSYPIEFPLPSLEEVNNMEMQRSQAIEALEISGNCVKCQRCGNTVPLMINNKRPKNHKIELLQTRIKWILEHRDSYCLHTSDEDIQRVKQERQQGQQEKQDDDDDTTATTTTTTVDTAGGKQSVF